MRSKLLLGAVAAVTLAGGAHAASVGAIAFQGDGPFVDRCSATNAGAGGSGNTACEYAVGEIRFGNGEDDGTERELGINDAATHPIAEGEFGWTQTGLFDNGQTLDFSFSYDAGSGFFELDVAGTRIATIDSIDLDGAQSLFIRIRDKDTDDFVALTALTLEGHAIPNASALGGFSSSVEYVQVFGIDFDADWTLAGQLAFAIGNDSSGSNPAAQFKVTNVAPIPLPAAGWMLIAGLGALGALRRRRAV